MTDSSDPFTSSHLRFPRISTFKVLSASRIEDCDTLVVIYLIFVGFGIDRSSRSILALRVLPTFLHGLPSLAGGSSGRLGYLVIICGQSSIA